MERLEATSELQSRLSSLSFSSFPGITSKQCDNQPLDRLQITDLSQTCTLPKTQADMDDTKEDAAQHTEGNEEAPAELALGEGGEENNSAGSCQLSAEMKAQMPPLQPPTTWTSAAVKELKAKLRAEEDSVVTVYRGDIMTVHVPTVPEAKKVCWEFATDGYDIGFGIYFDWTPVTSRSITVHISESSDDEDEEEELEGPVSNGDIEKGSKTQTNSNLAEILPVYRQDSHLSVNGGSHEFPVPGVRFSELVFGVDQSDGTYRSLRLNQSCGDGLFFKLLDKETVKQHGEAEFLRAVVPAKASRRCYQVHVPLPLPKHLVIFGLGEWKCSETTISVDVVVSAEVPSQNIGTLSTTARCLTWEGDWSTDLAAVAAEKGRRGVYGKIVLTMRGEEQETESVFSSTPLVQRKCLFPDQQNTTDLSCTVHESTANDTITASSSHLGDISYAEIQVNKVDTSDSTLENKPVWPTDKTPRRTVISKRGHLTWSSEDMDSLTEDIDQASTPKKRRLSRLNSQEEMTVQIKNDNREDNDFWFPMNSSASGPVPPCARGHTATYDPDSKSVFVYGGLRESHRYSELYILNTLTWKWKLVTAKGNVPKLAYHSAAFYKKELFVFGGVQPSHSSEDKSCSNALYIFNPEFELWYQPIVEGDRPWPRFGHSATLMAQKLMIFGGRKTATYLNDLHILDLGFMEYTAVKCGNMPPLPRGFHAALPVSDNRILVSGGCSAVGALQDLHIFNTDSNMWSSVASPPLCAKPRAGHSIISLGCSFPTDDEKHEPTKSTLLVFGGSDCCGNFFNDTLRCTVEIPADK
ncbi:uncharacterized protein V6R79_009857 [Siganus canaliculatus]